MGYYSQTEYGNSDTYVITMMNPADILLGEMAKTYEK